GGEQAIHERLAKEERRCRGFVVLQPRQLLLDRIEPPYAGRQPPERPSCKKVDDERLQRSRGRRPASRASIGRTFHKPVRGREIRPPVSVCVWMRRTLGKRRASTGAKSGNSSAGDGLQREQVVPIDEGGPVPPSSQGRKRRRVDGAAERGPRRALWMEHP